MPQLKALPEDSIIRIQYPNGSVISCPACGNVTFFQIAPEVNPYILGCFGCSKALVLTSQIENIC